MKAQAEAIYSIPARFRRLENLHIVFWLVKDISWCVLWKTLGVAMIFPTLGIAVFIAWRTRQMKSELAHNLAIAFWISANSYWMISEFYGFDEMHVWLQFEGKHLALIPFLTGAVILLYYYAIIRPREIKEKNVVTM